MEDVKTPVVIKKKQKRDHSFSYPSLEAESTATRLYMGEGVWKPSNTVPNARQLDKENGVRFLEQSFQDMILTASGKPLHFQKDKLESAKTLLEESNRDFEAENASTVTGADWPLLPIVSPGFDPSKSHQATPDGVLLHLVHPQALKVQPTATLSRKHPREVED